MKKNKKSWLYYLIAILVVLFGGTGVVGTVTDTETTIPQEATIVVEEIRKLYSWNNEDDKLINN